MHNTGVYIHAKLNVQYAACMHSLGQSTPISHASTHRSMHTSPLTSRLRPPNHNDALQSQSQSHPHPEASHSLLLHSLLAVKILRKLPLNSTPATRLLCSKRIHHPHVLFVAPRHLVFVVIEIVLLVVRTATGAVAVRCAAAVELVV